MSEWDRLVGEVDLDRFSDSLVHNNRLTQEEKRRIGYLVSLMTEHDKIVLMRGYRTHADLLRYGVRDISDNAIMLAFLYDASGQPRDRDNIRRLIQLTMSDKTLAAWRTMCRLKGEPFGRYT